MEDDHEDLFGDDDETDHFFLPEHYVQNQDLGDLAVPTQAVLEQKPSTKKERDNDSLVSDGLDDDEELPEEEEAANPLEDVDYEALIAQAHNNAEHDTGDRGNDVHLPDLGGIPAAATGAMARWMAGVEQPEESNGEVEEDADADNALSKDELLREYYPSFRSGHVLNFSDLFSAKAVPIPSRASRKARLCVPARVQLEVEASGSQYFKTVGRKKRKLGESDQSRIIYTAESHSPALLTKESQDYSRGNSLNRTDLDLILACAGWDDIIEPTSQETCRTAGSSEATAVGRPELHFIPAEFDSWSHEDIFEGIIDVSRIFLDLNDPNLFLTEENARTDDRSKGKLLAQTKRYDFSNDAAYAMLQENHQSRVRSNLTQLALEHAGFSDRLQSPYYKTSLSKSEARGYHRPAIAFKADQELRFSKVRPRKKKEKDRTKDPKVLLANTKDISLADNSGFICLEYSEEYPAILSNVGMGSKILNYYRKRNEEDEFRPSEICGEPSILGVTDRSPFWNFGAIEPGETTQTIYNRMYRAPVFRHTPAKTDFLLVKSSTRLGNRFYLRNMKHLYTVGQTLPVVDIPGPHSRKVTTSYKNRLKMITYRVIRKSEHQRLSIKDLLKHFPDQNELQIRQRLKDFMEYQRKGADQNFWKLKTGDILPTEEATRGMIDPETVCLIEAMQVGQRHLEDSGYGKSADADDDQDENMTTEQQLAPWIASRNFINATQGKAMLQLYGEGDPTGRGEAFSFIKTSMKGGFKVAGESVNDTLENEKPIPKGAHAYNVAKQQKAYEDEIAKIWNAQKSTLSMTSDEVLDNEEFDNNGEYEAESPFSAQSPGAASEQDDDLMSLNSGMSASSLNKVLKIQRVTRDAAGDLVTTTEVVQDPYVIHAYVQKRKALEDENLTLDGSMIAHTDDDEMKKRLKKKLEEDLAKLKRNAERRRLRKIQKEAGLIKSKSKKAKTVEV